MDETLSILKAFWAEIGAVWQGGVFGISLTQILIGIVILAAFYVLRGLITKFIIASIMRWTAKTETELDDKILAAITPPLRLLILVLGLFVAIGYLELDKTLGDFDNNIIRALITFCLFWGLHALIDPLMHALKPIERLLSSELAYWLARALRWVIVFIGASAIFQIWGIEVGPIIAGFGLFGVAVALGAQDLFKNLIAGISILVEKRFRRGDWIKVEGVIEGTVEAINFRSTKVRRFDKAPVYVPNASLSDSALINFSAMTYRRIYWKIGLTYSTSIEQLAFVRAELEKYISSHEAFVRPPAAPVFVRIDNFNDSSIDILLYVFTNTTDWGKWLKIKEDLAYTVIEIVKAAGADFAFPSRSIYMEAADTAGPDRFVPDPAFDATAWQKRIGHDGEAGGLGTAGGGEG